MDLLKEYKGMIIPPNKVDNQEIVIDKETFKVSFDFREIPNLMKAYNEKRNVRSKTVKQATMDEYLNDIAQMKSDILSMSEDPKFISDIIINAPRKKNRTLAIGRILFHRSYKNTAKIFTNNSSWTYNTHYWTHFVLKIRAVDDNEIKVYIEEEAL